MISLSCEFLISDDRQFDGDVALGRLRGRADRVGFLNQLLELVLVGARYRNLELDAKTEAAVLLIQRDLAGHARGLTIEAVFFRNKQDRLTVAGGVTHREQLLRSG